MPDGIKKLQIPPFNELIRAWAADKEQVTRLDISDISWTTDEGWGGTDVTPGDPAKLIVEYSVHKRMIHTVEFEEIGEFIVELSQVLSHGPITHIQAEDVEMKHSSVRPARGDEIEVLLPEPTKIIRWHGTPLFVSAERYAEPGDTVSFNFRMPDHLAGMRIAVVFCEVKE